MTLVCEGNRPNDAHRVILSTVTLPKMSTRTNSQFVAASVTEFLAVWSLGGEATLNLTTRNGHAQVNFNCTLGHPCAPHSLPPSPTPSPTPAPPPHRPRHRGPTERERNRQRAARHQEARNAVPATSSPSALSVTGSVTAPSSSSPETGPADKNSEATVSVTKTTVSEAVISTSFQCDKCDFISNSDHGVKVHKGTKHKETLTPVKESREEYTEETKSPVHEFNLDSHKEHSDSENKYEQACLERSNRLDDHAKTIGSWCYECNDRCKDRSVLKRHMRNDHGLDIYPEIDMMLHGGW